MDHKKRSSDGENSPTKRLRKARIDVNFKCQCNEETIPELVMRKSIYGNVHLFCSECSHHCSNCHLWLEKRPTDGVCDLCLEEGMQNRRCKEMSCEFQSKHCNNCGLLLNKNRDGPCSSRCFICSNDIVVCDECQDTVDKDVKLENGGYCLECTSCSDCGNRKEPNDELCHQCNGCADEEEDEIICID